MSSKACKKHWFFSSLQIDLTHTAGPINPSLQIDYNNKLLKKQAHCSHAWAPSFIPETFSTSLITRWCCLNQQTRTVHYLFLPSVEERIKFPNYNIIISCSCYFGGFRWKEYLAFVNAKFEQPRYTKRVASWMKSETVRAA
jgi:hypothetical protein